MVHGRVYIEGAGEVCRWRHHVKIRLPPSPIPRSCLLEDTKYSLCSRLNIDGYGMDVLPTEYLNMYTGWGGGGGGGGDMTFCHHRMLCARTGGPE